MNKKKKSVIMWSKLYYFEKNIPNYSYIIIPLTTAKNKTGRQKHMAYFCFATYYICH